MFSAVEDYTKGHQTNPCVPEDLRDVLVGPVVVGAHTIVGSSSVVLGGVTLGFGCSVGVLTLVSRRVRPFEVEQGNPARRVQVLEPASGACLRSTCKAAQRGVGLRTPWSSSIRPVDTASDRVPHVIAIHRIAYTSCVPGSTSRENGQVQLIVTGISGSGTTFTDRVRRQPADGVVRVQLFPYLYLDVKRRFLEAQGMPAPGLSRRRGFS